MPLKKCNGTDPGMKKRKDKKGSARYHLEFSGSSMFFWSLALFFLMGWLFVLGILVGRGFLNEKLENISELKNSIAKLQKMVKEKESSQKIGEKAPDKDPEFAFYKELVDEKGGKTGQLKPAGDKDDGAIQADVKPPKESKEREGPIPEPAKPVEPLPSDSDRVEESGRMHTESSQKQPSEKNLKEAEKSGSFSLQVASLTTGEQAQKLISTLKDRGYSSFINKVNVGGKTYYRVHCGPFGSRQEALSFKKAFSAKEKMEGIIARHTLKKEPVRKASGQPASKPGRKPEKEKKKGGFTIQIASLNSEDEARKMVKRFQSLGYPAYFYRTTVKGITRFRVRCGTFQTRKDAEEFREKLAKKEFVVGFVTGIEQ
jgi:cell division septation protein DedD